MKVMKIKAYFNTLEEVRRYYDKTIKRSRTYEDGVKAVRVVSKKIIGVGSMNNTTIRSDGAGGFIFRLHNTDIAHYQADGWVRIDLGGWNTVTTFDRIWRATGFCVRSFAPSQHTTDQLTRIFLEEPRSGAGEYGIHRSVPFFSGMRINTSTREIHPDDEAKIPTERRRKYRAPSKEATDRFGKVWKRIYPRIIFGLTLGGWVEDIDREVGAGYFRMVYSSKIAGAHPRITDEVVSMESDADYETPEKMLRDMYTAYIDGTYIGKDAQSALRRTVPKARRKMLEEFALEKGLTETKGGNILGGVYWVNPKDKEVQNEN